MRKYQHDLPSKAWVPFFMHQGEDKVLKDYLNFKYCSVIILNIKHEKDIPDPAGCNRYYGR